MSHQPGLGRLPAEGERRHRLRPEVDREDLENGERQRHEAPGRREHDERHGLGRRVGEDVDDELPDVVVDTASGLDRLHDRREVVVGEHHRRRLARDIRPRPSHRDADVGAAQGRRIVHSVARHRDDVALGAQRVRDAELRLRRAAREDQLGLFTQQPVELRLPEAPPAPRR